MDNIIDVVITAEANALTYVEPAGSATEDDRVDFREVACLGLTLLR